MIIFFKRVFIITLSHFVIIIIFNKFKAYTITSYVYYSIITRVYYGRTLYRARYRLDMTLPSRSAIIIIIYIITNI